MAKKSLKVNKLDHKNMQQEKITDAEFVEDHMLI